MAELLPQEWLFPVHDGKEMIRCLRDILLKDQEQHLRRNRELVDSMDTAAFRKGFCTAVLSCLEQGQSR